jgi:hypothetical protein
LNKTLHVKANLMRVEAASLITAAPQNIGVIAGNAANFSVTAQGTSLSYAWQRSNDGGATYAPVAGIAASLSLVAEPTDNGALFRVKISNAGGSVTSTPDVFPIPARVGGDDFWVHIE